MYSITRCINHNLHWIDWTLHITQLPTRLPCPGLTLPAGDGHGGMIQALLQSLATNSCFCLHDISWCLMKVLYSSWFLNSLMGQLHGLRMKQRSSHVLLSLANLFQWQLGWTQLWVLAPNYNEENTFQISHTAFVLPCSLHVKRLLGLCQTSVCRGMSRWSRRSSCPPASTHPWPPRPPFRMAGWTLTCAVREFKVEMDGHGVMPLNLCDSTSL